MEKGEPDETRRDETRRDEGRGERASERGRERRWSRSSGRRRGATEVEVKSGVRMQL